MSEVQNARDMSSTPEFLALLLAAGVGLQALLLHCCGVHINDCAIAR